MWSIKVYLEFDPHTKKNGGCIHNEPGHTQTKEKKPLLLLVAKQDGQQDDEGRGYPHNQDTLVEYVVQGKP